MPAFRRSSAPKCCPTGVLSLLVLLCIAMAPHALSYAQSPERGVAPTRCEQRLDGLYETRGPATIDKLGEQYVLTLRCDGVHQVYVRASRAFDLAQIVGKPVRVRYRYVDETSPRTECVRAPCPPATQRVIEIMALHELTGALYRTNPPGR